MQVDQIIDGDAEHLVADSHEVGRKLKTSEIR